MSRLTSDLSTETYVVNSDILRSGRRALRLHRRVGLDGDDAGGGVGGREVDHGEAARVEIRSVVEVTAGHRPGGQRDLAHDLGQYRSVTAQHGGLACADAFADHRPDFATALLVGLLADAVL